MTRWLLVQGWLLLTTLLSGCVVTGVDKDYQGPKPRPQYLEAYYQHSGKLNAVSEEILSQTKHYTLKRITLKTEVGETVIDYRQLPNAHDELIFVFPILGGRNIFANYFAEHFSQRGYDTAIVHRDNEFKNPDNLPIIEDLFRKNVIRDRIAIDYFEQTYNKKRFGTFGISRGAINAATTAGVDPRLEANVLALGATDLIQVMNTSTDASITRFREKIILTKNIPREELINLLEEKIYTSPDAVAHHLDAKKTLIFLAIFDKTVPFYYGFALKEQIGDPETVYLFADHFTALLYTQFVPLILPYRPLAFFPFSYIETKSLTLYDEVFGRNQFRLANIPLRAAESPFYLLNLLGELFD